MADADQIDIEARISSVAVDIHLRYPDFVSVEDVAQELRVYALGDGKRHLDRFVADGDNFRVMRALYGAGKQYANREKAAQSGYHVDDVAWYTPAKLADLMPLALDPGWDGLTGDGDDAAGYGSTDGREGGTLLAMVADVRRALGGSPSPEWAGRYDPLTDTGLENLRRLADRLGGEFPESPGYGRGRRALSNAAAKAATENGYSR